jgi:uncharacterized protein YdeI (YjbR/CyaY-like superfamily)
MEMAYRERWQAEITELQRILSGFDLREECKWGKPCYKAATIKAYVREAVAAEQAGMKVETKPPEFPVPEELKEKFRNDPRFKRAFEALTPGRQRGYLFHFAGAKQSGTRTARIEKAMPAIFEGRGFLERR